MMPKSSGNTVLIFKERIMAEEKTNRRVRMSVSVTAKGLAQWEVTAEGDSPEEAEADLNTAINTVRFTIAKEGLVEVGQEVEKK
jgi:translation initiation factor 2 alpha subunit (eIF-2alpha)